MVAAVNESDVANAHNGSVGCVDALKEDPYIAVRVGRKILSIGGLVTAQVQVRLDARLHGRQETDLRSMP